MNHANHLVITLVKKAKALQHDVLQGFLKTSQGDVQKTTLHIDTSTPSCLCV